MWTVAGLFRYLLKSAAGQSLDYAIIGPRGILFDREWLIVDARTGMFVAQRSDQGRGIAIPQMCLIRPNISQTDLELHVRGMPMLGVPLEPETGPEMEVQIWDDRLLAVDQGDAAAEWITAYLRPFRSGDYRLVRMSPVRTRNTRHGTGQVAFADADSLLVMGEESWTDLNRRIMKRGGQALPMNRYRPNMVIRGFAPYAEDYMARVRINNVHLEGLTLCVRCGIPKINQDTGKAESPEPTATFKTYRNNPDEERGGLVFGRNFNNLTTGFIRVGNLVLPVAWDNPWQGRQVDWTDPVELYRRQIGVA